MLSIMLCKCCERDCLGNPGTRQQPPLQWLLISACHQQQIFCQICFFLSRKGCWQRIPQAAQVTASTGVGLGGPEGDKALPNPALPLVWGLWTPQWARGAGRKPHQGQRSREKTPAGPGEQGENPSSRFRGAAGWAELIWPLGLFSEHP